MAVEHTLFDGFHFFHVKKLFRSSALEKLFAPSAVAEGERELFECQRHRDVKSVTGRSEGADKVTLDF